MRSAKIAGLIAVLTCAGWSCNSVDPVGPFQPGCGVPVHAPAALQVRPLERQDRAAPNAACGDSVPVQATRAAQSQRAIAPRP